MNKLRDSRNVSHNTTGKDADSLIFDFIEHSFVKSSTPETAAASSIAEIVKVIEKKSNKSKASA